MFEVILLDFSEDLSEKIFFGCAYEQFGRTVW